MSTPMDYPRRRGRRPCRSLPPPTSEPRRGRPEALRLDKLAPAALINLTALHDYKEGSDGPQMASQLTDDAAAGVELGFGEVVRLSGAARGPSRRPGHTGRAIVIATGLALRPARLAGEDEYGRAAAFCIAPPAMARSIPGYGHLSRGLSGAL